MVDADGRNLVFVLSTPRAGSTLLAAMLGSHPDVFAPPEPWLLLPLLALTSESAQIIAAYDDQLARHALRASVAPLTLSRARAAFATTIYNAALAPSGKHIFVDKTPRYYHLTDELDRIFPHAKKIWLLRNPLDVIASCCRTWSLSLDEVLGDAISPHSFDATIAFPRLATYFARRTSEQMTVRYEDLARDLTTEARRVCDHLGLAFDPVMLAYRSNTALVESYAASALGDKKTLTQDRPETPSVGRWRDTFAPADVQRILATLGTEIFATLGYGAELDEAATLIGAPAGSLPARGRLDDLSQQAAEYALHNVPNGPGGQRTLQVKQLMDLQKQLQQQEGLLQQQRERAALDAAQRAPAGKPVLRWIDRIGLGRLFAPREP